MFFDGTFVNIYPSLHKNLLVMKVFGLVWVIQRSQVLLGEVGITPLQKLRNRLKFLILGITNTLKLSPKNLLIYF